MLYVYVIISVYIHADYINGLPHQSAQEVRRSETHVLRSSGEDDDDDDYSSSSGDDDDDDDDDDGDDDDSDDDDSSSGGNNVFNHGVS